MILKSIPLFVIAIAGFLMSINLQERVNNPKIVKKAMETDFAFIPSGNTIIDSKTVSVQSFYIGKGEVTNKSYNEFLADLMKNSELTKYAISNPDPKAWDILGPEFYPFKNQYMSHELYQSYPVVNVSYEGAQLYCEWLSEKFEKETEGKVKLIFRIPSREEWLRAARGDDHRAVYAHGSKSLMNEKGCLMANFKHFGDEHIHYNSEKNQYEMLPVNSANADNKTENTETLVKAISFKPNKYGVYNMNGNAAEMISEKGLVVGGDWLSTGYDIRNESIKKMAGPHPTVGFRVVATYYSPSK